MVKLPSKILPCLSWLVMIAALTGCSGSSSDPAAVASVETRLIAGTVEDGPIAGARVELIDRDTGLVVSACGASGQGLCSQQSDGADGHFSFLLALDRDPSTLVVRAVGGVDQLTRLDFSRIGFAPEPLQLLAPLSGYAGRLTNVSVNPLSTLYARATVSAGDEPLSENELRDRLGPGLNFALLASPAEAPEAQRLAMLLGRIALFSEEDQPFATLEQQLAAGTALFDATGQLNRSILEGVLSTEQIDQVVQLNQSLLAVDNPAEMGHQVRLHELVTGFETALFSADSSVLSNSGSLDPADPALQPNLEVLAEQIILAVGEHLLLGGRAAEHLARYVLYAYGLEDADLLTSAPDLFATHLVRSVDGGEVALSEDAELHDLATLQVSHVISVPLPEGSLAVADDLMLSDLKRDYYYSSDISHLFRAKQLVWNLRDDQVRDTALVDVVAGEALAGRFTEAESLIASQIYQTEPRGLAWVRFAEGLTAHGRYQAAYDALRRAEDLFRQVVAVKGEASFSADDAENFLQLARWYVRAGYPEDALAVVRYLDQEVAEYLTSTTAYGRLTSAGMTVVETFVASDDEVRALEALELTYQLALGMPDDSRGTARYLVRALIDVAERFADFGAFTRVWEIWGQIAELRYTAGFLNETGTATEVYMPALVPVIYAAGGVDEAYALIDSLPAGTGVFDRYHAEAIKHLATFLAVRDGLGADRPVPPAARADYTAMDLINFALTPDFFNPTVADSQVEALTYYNTAVAYVAQAMIDRQLFEEAGMALLKAEEIVDGLDPNGVKLRSNAKINYGYAKLAELYLQMGQQQAALRLLDKGAGVLPLIADPTNHAKAVALLADLFLDLGDFTAAGELLATIGDEIELDGYRRIIEAQISAGDVPTALTYIAAYADVGAASYDPASMDDSTLGGAAVSALVKAAGYYSHLGFFPEAVATLQRALPIARDIPNQATGLARLSDIAAGLAQARADGLARDLAWSLPFASSRNDALLAIASELAARDDFPDNPVATVDLDGDGLADFFSPTALPADILASGVGLDRDSDNDGVADAEDRWPFFSLLPSR